MIEKFDYEEPLCPLTGGKEFYAPEEGAPLGRIPVGRVIERVDALFDKNDYAAAGKLLEYWRDEAVALRDRHGELSMESELVGFYRKQGNVEKGLTSVDRALSLARALNQFELASGATVLINCATAYKAFSMAEKALPLYRRAEEIYHRLLPPEDARLGGLYNNMALTLAELGMTSDAEAAYLRALDVMQSIPQGAAECAITYVNMAHMYEEAGDYGKIRGCMEAARELLKSPALPHDGYYAFVLEKCAPSFGYFGDRDTYLQMKQEAEHIYARS